MLCGRKRAHAHELPGMEQTRILPWFMEAGTGAHVTGGRGGLTGCVPVTAPYVDLTLVSSHPGSSLWPGRSSQPAGPGGRPAGRSGAEAAARQAGQLQHRGAAGRGRLRGALPRQGARAELRPHPHEHRECPRVWGLRGWAGGGVGPPESV